MGVAQKMTYFKDQFENNYYPDAEYFSKLQSMSATTDMIRNNRRRFQIFQLTQR
jgi:hypothetical protein